MPKTDKSLMKVLVIPQSYPTDERPNLTPFIRENTEYLHSMGYNVSVLLVDMLPIRKWFHHYSVSVNQYQYNNIPVFYMAMQHIHGQQWLNTKQFEWKLNILFKKYVKENGFPDIIISHFSQYAGYCASMISKKHNIPLVVVEHAGWLLAETINEYEKKKVKETVDVAADFICVSEALKEAICKITNQADRIHVIPNMISDVYRYVEREEKANFTFFSAGNLYAGKRMDLLINAFCEAFGKEEKVQLRIAGDGGEYAKLHSMIESNKREHQVFLLGSLDKEEMNVEYQNCDVFVLPSHHETFGIVYREALAVGRPIITTDHQGFKGNLWRDEFGIKIPIDDMTGLVQALKHIVASYDSYDQRKISEFVISNYSAQIVMNQFSAIIEKQNK